MLRLAGNEESRIEAAMNATWQQRLLQRAAVGLILVLTTALVVAVLSMPGACRAAHPPAAEPGASPAVSAKSSEGDSPVFVPTPTTSAPRCPVEARKSGQSPEDTRFVKARQKMVAEQLRGRDITDRQVLEVMGRLPRQRFVPEQFQDLAYADRPLPIGHAQTISQPYIVALMTQAVRPKPEGRALDIGTGSGYQAAVLAELCKEVYSIEILKPLADDARKRLAAEGYTNVTVRQGDGYQGWPEKAPFDVIIVAAAPEHVPKPLVEQLAPGGRLVIPVGRFFQDLLVIEKQPDGTTRRRSLAPVMFVPMRGEAEGAGSKPRQ
jgi:protein-L-isoaspartate(D-aspartate) O-methyltransferase